MQVKDLMVPIQEYAKVDQEANLYDALLALETAQSKLSKGKAPHRAVLVENESGELVGNIGRLVFVKALGSEFGTLKTKEAMNRAGISQESISTVMGHMRFFQGNMATLRDRAKAIKAKDVMHPVGESIDERASIQDAIDMFGTWQTLSILVKRGDVVVGVLRLSDLFQEMTKQIFSPEPPCTG